MACQKLSIPYSISKTNREQVRLRALYDVA